MYRMILAAASSSLVLGTSTAVAQPVTGPLRPLEYPGGAYPGVNFPVDRRPFIFQSLITGSTTFLTNNGDGPGQIAGVPDPDDDYTGFQGLISRLDQLYDLGFRRVGLNRPAGSLGARYDQLNPWQQYGYEVFIADWIAAHPDVSFEIWTRPNDLPGNVPSLDTAGVVEDFLAELEPWHDIGVRFIWLDSSFNAIDVIEAANDSELFYDLASDRRTYIAGEAGAPIVSGGVWPSESQVPWMAASQNPFWGALGGPEADVNPLVSMVSYWLLATSPTGIQQVYDIARSGKSVGLLFGNAQYASSFELVKRVFEFGVVDKPADFDGNGIVDTNDGLLFAAQFGDTNDAADPTFYEGDYDQDGDTDGDDVNLFLIDFNAGGGLSRDLGVSAQPPLWPEHRVAPLP